MVVGVSWASLSLASHVRVAAGVCEDSPQEVLVSAHHYNAASMLQAGRKYTDTNADTNTLGNIISCKANPPQFVLLGESVSAKEETK